MLKKKENKNIIKPNCCNFRRWVFVIVISCSAVFLTSGILPLFQKYFTTDSVIGTLYPFIGNMIPFVVGFWVAVFAIKGIAKTPIKDFIFGLHGQLNVKKLIVIGSLYLLGLLIAALIFDKWQLNTITKPSVIAVNAILSLLLTWMQASLEEFWFRGIVIRMVGKGECGTTIKLILSGFMISVLFMLSHFTNAEVSKQSGILNTVLILSVYFISGLILFVLDLMYGNLMPGLVLHAINNMWCFILISSANTSEGTATIFVNQSNTTAIVSFLSLIIAFLPVIVYTLTNGMKKKLPGLKTYK